MYSPKRAHRSDACRRTLDRTGRTRTRFAKAAQIRKVSTLALVLSWHSLMVSADPIQWRQDPETGLMVAQLTESTPDNTDYYALYYHQDSLGGQGRYGVHRSIRANALGTGLDTTTRIYWRLDLETGDRLELMPAGQAADAFVRGDEVFLFHREMPGSPVNTISVMNLVTLEPKVLANVGLATLAGAIAVNADATLLL